jgi:hypothetical protein
LCRNLEFTDCDSTDAVLYLLRLAERNRVPVDADLARGYRLAEDVELTDPLQCLQAAIARLGCSAETAFGEQMAARPIGICSLVDAKVHIADCPSRGRLKAAIKAAAQAAYCIALPGVLRKLSALPRALGITGIRARLYVLILEVFPEIREAADEDSPEKRVAVALSEDREWMKIHASALFEEFTSKALSFPRARPGSGGMQNATLTLGHIEWLGSLLWHTLRFDARFYPSTAELAFQLSLTASEVPPMRAELAQAAEVAEMHDGKYLFSQMNESFAYYEKSERDNEGRSIAPSPGRLHHAIARYLKESQRRRPSLQTWQARKNDFWPLVITTNYDNEIERALEEAGCPYNLLIPAYRCENGFRRPVWFGGTSRGDDHAWTPYIPQVDTELEANDAVAILGAALMSVPLVVKLHGSVNWPASLLNAAKALSVDGAEIIPRFVLTESDYISETSRATKDEDKVLFAIDLELRKRASTADPADNSTLICFLGHSVSDWNVRMRIHERLRGDKAPAMRSLVVSRKIDRYRQEVLRRLMLTVSTEELTTIATVLEGAVETLESYQEGW